MGEKVNFSIGRQTKKQEPPQQESQQPQEQTTRITPPPPTNNNDSKEMMEMLRNRRLLSLLFFIVVGDVIVKVSSFTTAGQATQQQPQQQPPQQESLLIFGLGRVGRQVATLAQPHFKHIAGTVRRRNSSNEETTNQHEDESSKDTIECIPISLEDDDDTNLLSCRIANASHILIAMPPDDKVYSTILQECSSTKQLQWLGMISTTSVYGNHNGSWVNESSPVLQLEVSCNNNGNNNDNNNNPNSSRSSNSLDYLQWEERFQNNLSNTDASVAIFRCAGIYDASKSALHTLWKRGYSPPTTTNTTTRTLTNRIHVLDIAHAIVQSMILNTTTTTSQSRIYNLADDCPASRSEVLEYAAQLFDEHDISLPQQQPAATTNTKTSQRERRRETDRKLVDNTRMKMELLSLSSQQQQLKYPTYKEGLSAIFHDPMAPWWEQQRDKGKRSK